MHATDGYMTVTLGEKDNIREEEKEKKMRKMKKKMMKDEEKR